MSRHPHLRTMKVAGVFLFLTSLVLGTELLDARDRDVCKWQLDPDDCICMNSVNGTLMRDPTTTCCLDMGLKTSNMASHRPQPGWHVVTPADLGLVSSPGCRSAQSTTTTGIRSSNAASGWRSSRASGTVGSLRGWVRYRGPKLRGRDRLKRLLFTPDRIVSPARGGKEGGVHWWASEHQPPRQVLTFFRRELYVTTCLRLVN